MRKTIGTILIILFGMALLGGFVNGTFANMGGRPLGYYLGFFGTMGAMLIGGIALIASANKNNEQSS